MTEINLSKISEVQLVYRRKVKADDRPKVSCSQDAYALFRENWDDLTINLCEQFKVMLLDRNNRCLGIANISSGGVSGTYVDSKLVYVAAIKSRACNIIVAHNHPSGNLKASNPDLLLTNKLHQAGKLLDLPLLDHLIITDESYTSLADQGMIPS